MSQDQLEEWQTKLSPAPWRGDHGEIYDANNNVVVFMNVRDEKFNVADERLIEAAPSLLVALQKCVDMIEHDYGGYDAIETWQNAVKIINQIKGNTRAAAES